MDEKILYGYTGLFDTPDEIIEAAEKTSAEGFEKYDVHTPYPVHGMDSAMQLKPSKLPYIALAIGLSAMVGMFLFMSIIVRIGHFICTGRLRNLLMKTTSGRMLEASGIHFKKSGKSFGIITRA